MRTLALLSLISIITVSVAEAKKDKGDAAYSYTGVENSQLVVTK